MHFVSKSMVMVLAATLAACGLYEDVPVFSGDVLKEGDSCGPCDLGVYGASSCDLGELDGAVDPSAACSTVIFVDAERGSDEAEAGTQDKPFETLKAAIRAGNERNASVVVVAGDDVHQGPIQLGDGLSIVGGYDRSWVVDTSRKPAVRAEASDTLADSWAVLASGIQRPTILRNLRIESTGEAKTHYGVRAINSQGLLLEGVRVTAAAGRDGEDGQGGVAGVSGSRGENGGVGDRRDEGQAGTNSACPEANGGAGGRGGFQESALQEAREGLDSAAGVEGGSPGEDGEHGSDGEAGMQGEPGTRGFVDGGYWRLGERGETGGSGAHGTGGGGGGGGPVIGGDGKGGGGAGGGAGGCGGEGGAGGEPGGASFGILVVDSELAVVDSEVISADGGAGGNGGEGGAGGEGEFGGLGMDGSNAGEAGGDGGNGGDGGPGGAGGPGRGGVSYGIYCAGGVSVSVEDTELRFGDGGLMGGGSEERASSSASQGCGI